MKKLTLILGMIVITSIVSAQWYQSYGVMDVNELNIEQCQLALEKANKSIKAGKIMTFTGAIAGVIGGVIYSNSLKNMVTDMDYQSADHLGSAYAGAGLLYGGLIVCGIGIPLWISADARKNQIEIVMKKFDTMGMAAVGVGIKLKF